METQFLKLVKSRRSIRRFKPDPVEREKILACLEAARLAPSAHNIQPWRFLVIDDPLLKSRLAEGAFSGIYRASKFAAQAPAIVILMARLDIIADRVGARFQGTPFHILDLGIAGEHFILRAEELGLGTCWMGWFNYRRARKILRIPRKYKIVAMIAVGWPSSRPVRERPLKPLEDVAWWNEIGKPFSA